MREHKKSHLGIMGWAIYLAGAMSLGSCSTDETIESMEPTAITFGSVSMENHSRAVDPSYGANKILDQFNVWGTVTGNVSSAQIFNGAVVTNAYKTDASNDYGYGQVWNCTQTQYWISDADYKFLAIANADPTKVTKNDIGIPTAIQFNLTDGSKDLLLSQLVTAETNALAQPTSGVNSTGCVPFTFSHLLSKVHFTFDGSAANVANIQVTGHNGTGTYNISTATWGSQESTKTPLSFGGIDTQANDNTSANARLIIPGEQTWTITILDSKGNTIGNSLTLDYTAANDDRTSGGFIFAPNTQYNVQISLGVDLSLSVSVQGWNTHEIPNDFANDVAVSTNGHIIWTDVAPIYVNEDGNTNISEEKPIVASWVVFDKTKTQATFTFQIDGPMGGTWNAMLVTQQGTSEVFQIVKVLEDADGNEIEEVADMGKVGERYTLRIKTISPNNSDIANKAELRIVVQQGGEILPAHKLMNHGEGHSLNGVNYIMVQNK